MLPTFLIFFREALEASLIVGILLAYLHWVGGTAQARAVWLGVGAAVVVDLVVALATYRVVHAYDGSRVQTILEGSTYLAAAGILTYMSFWMKQQGRTLRGDLEARARAVLSRGSLVGMILLSALSVGREGLETAFFTLAIAFGARPWALAIGAGFGLGAGLGVSACMHRLGRRAPLALFFNVLGALLLLFGAGLLADGVQAFQSLKWLPFLTHTAWDSQALLTENSVLGDILHSFVGYAQAPSVLQVSAYAGFLSASVVAFLRDGRRGGARV